MNSILLPPPFVFSGHGYADGGVSGAELSEMYSSVMAGEAPRAMGAGLSTQTIQESMRLLLMVRAYQVRRCRLNTQLDPVLKAIGFNHLEITLLSKTLVSN